jgi:hypothetical protein
VQTLTLRRWVVIVAGLAGIALAVLQTHWLWNAAGFPLEDRLDGIAGAFTDIAFFGISVLIAWRGAHQAANLSIALALTASFWNDLLSDGFTVLHRSGALYHSMLYLTFFLGAGFYIRASQQFPRTITAADLVASPTIWGRTPLLRQALSALSARPILVWIFVACMTSLTLTAPDSQGTEVTELTIVALGIIYFYVSYRSGDAESRRKVLWFLALAVCVAAFELIGVALRAMLGGSRVSASSQLRVIISVALNSSFYLAEIGCTAAALFYAGAISPSLVIRKTVVYGLTIPLFLFGFATIEVFTAEHLVEALRITDHFASAMIGGVFGLAFHPVKQRVEKLLERFHLKHEAGSTHQAAQAS